MRKSLFVAVVGWLAGCVEAPTQPDVSNLGISTKWTGEKLTVRLELEHREIPCSGTDDNLVGEEPIDCTSAPWTVTVDGIEAQTTPIKCTSAYDAFLAGPQEKECEGGTGEVTLGAGNEDIVIVATTAVDEQRYTIHGVRREFTLTEEAPYESENNPGLVRVADLTFSEGARFQASFTPPDDSLPEEGSARRSLDDDTLFELRPTFLRFRTIGTYGVLFFGESREGTARIARPIVGTFTVAKR